MTVARAAKAPREPDSSGLERFVHDVDVTRFDSRLGRLFPIALAVLVGVIAATWAARPRSGPGSSSPLGWRSRSSCSSEIAGAPRTSCTGTWRTGSGDGGWRRDRPAPARGPGRGRGLARRASTRFRAQVYRAIAAVRARNEVVIAREVAALPDATPDDRAWRQWVIQSGRFVATGDADVDELRSLLPDLANAEDRAALETWLAQVDAARLHAQGDRAWLAPLVGMWPRPGGCRSGGLGPRGSGSAASSCCRSSPSAPSPSGASAPALDRDGGLADVPADYARTEIATRGDVGDIDDRRLVASLPGLAASLATATPLEAGALDAFRTNDLIAGGLPTLIWDTHRIGLEPPPDAPGRHVWSIEVLLDGDGLGRDAAIVTFDAEDGEAYLYRIDPAVVAAIAAAVGNEATGSP